MSTQALSRANRETILRCVRARGQLSRAQIASETGLSTATVSRLVLSLMRAELLVKAGPASQTGGRPLLMVKFNDSAAVILAVDIADRHTSVALVDLGAKILHIERHPSPPDGSADDRIRQSVRLVRDGFARASDLGYHCVAAGLSVPGPVDADGTVDFAPALGWRRVPLGALLEQQLPVPVLVENDANLIAVAEHQHGQAKGASSLVSIAVFDGIGSGIIVNGTIWRGAAGAAGQIGRMLLDRKALRQVYSGFGDLETQLGAAGIARRAAQAGLGHDGQNPALDRVFRLRKSGEPSALAFLDEIFDEFAMSLANVCAILDPQVIVFAGLFAQWSDVVIPALTKRLVGHVLHLPRLLAASSPADGALIGAAHAAFEKSGSVSSLL